MRWRRRHDVLAVHGNSKVKAVARLLDPAKPVIFVPEGHPELDRLRSLQEKRNSMFVRLKECRAFFGGLIGGKKRRREFLEAVRRETKLQEELLEKTPGMSNQELAAPVDVFEADGKTIVVVRKRTFAQHKAMMKVLQDAGYGWKDIRKLRKAQWGFIPDLSNCIGSNGFVRTKDNRLLFTVRSDPPRIDASPNQLATSYSGPPRWSQLGSPPGPTLLAKMDVERSAKELGIDPKTVITDSHRTYMIGTQADGGPMVLSYMDIDMTRDELLQVSENAEEKWQNKERFDVEFTESAIRERLDAKHPHSLVREGADWFAAALIGVINLHADRFSRGFADEVSKALAGRNIPFSLAGQ